MSTPNRSIIPLCIIAAALLPFAAAFADQASPALPENSGVALVKSVAPQLLKIQDISTKNEMCAQVVEIVDPATACKASKCLTPFNYGAKVVEPMKPGFRGIYVSQCKAKTPDRGYLLWGPENLLILNAARAPEKNLWTQTKQKSHKAINFATEASSGKLFMKNGKFEWAEGED